MMLRTAILLALAVGTFATGCYVEEDYYCVRKDYVDCGGDPCYGHCALDYRKACDKKVGYKTVCEEENFCKEIEIPCGHDGIDPTGLFCSASEECVVDTECKLIPAVKKHSFAGWKTTPRPNGYFEVCKDVYACVEADPWDLDDDVIDVVCKKEYTIEEDMDCGLLINKFAPERKFFKMNPHFSCDREIVGKIVCVEAEAFIKVEECADGTICEEGYECATREICTQVPVAKPVCDRVPFYTCLSSGGSGSELCGNKICSGREKCEVVTNTVCPTVDPIVVPVPIPTPVPVIPVPIPTPNPDPTPVIPSGVSSASASSISSANPDGAFTDTDATVINSGSAVATANAEQDDNSAFSLSDVLDNDVIVETEAISGSGVADAIATGQFIAGKHKKRG